MEALVLVTRLDDLVNMASTENKYEKASVYAANKAILFTFESSKLSSNQKIMELLRASCFYINAAIGYELIISKTPEQCLTKARDKLIELRNIINIYYL